VKIVIVEDNSLLSDNLRLLLSGETGITVLGAFGQGPELSWVDLEPDEIRGGLEVSRQGRLVVDPNTFRTGVPKIFAGGDVNLGATTVVEAIGDGRRASYAMDYWLRGHDLDDPGSAASSRAAAQS
jgi:NADPH-dependent glutamate synthase beta subunit-like oxidoreductase